MEQGKFEQTPVLPEPEDLGITPVVEVCSAGVVTPTSFKKKNRRAWVRWPCDLEAYCQPHPVAGDKLWWLARVRKVSRGGLRLLLSLALEVGAIVEVEIHTAAGAFPRTLAARVVHAAPLRYGGWTYGCALLEVMSEEELRHLLA